MKVCRACKKELSIGREVGRKDECPFCGADLHACLNCKFHDRSASRQCREPLAEPVKEKEKANFCDYFVFAEASTGALAAETDKERKELEGLFRK